MIKAPSNYDRRPLDRYCTEDDYPIRALVKVMDYDRNARILEPCCGEMHMVNQLEALGYKNIATNDIEAYEGVHPDTMTDFLAPSADALAAWRNVRVVITNPPYGFNNKLFTAIVRQSLDLFPHAHVALMCDATWDMGVSRLDLTRNNHRFIGKINLCHRVKFINNRAGSTWHAWYLWSPVDKEKESLDQQEWFPSIAYVTRDDLKENTDAK